VRVDGGIGAAPRGSGEREQKRRHARPPVDPGSEHHAERDTAHGSSSQDRAQRERAEARLIDKEENDVGKGDRVREANKDIDDDQRDEERRAVGVRSQRSLVVATKDARGFTTGANRAASG